MSPVIPATHQRTLAAPFEFTGVGLHSGQTVRVKCLPAAPHTGIQLHRVDIAESSPFSADYRSVDAAAMQRQTTLCGPAGARVATIEHLLSACAGLGITNMLVELDGQEVPQLDGSALPFMEWIHAAGVQDQPEAPVKEWVISEPVTFREGEVEIVALPDSSTRFTYFADFPSPVGTQAFHYDLTTDYATEVAPARTFVFEQEIEMLRKANLIRGGSLENALVITSTGYMNGPLRFDNEIARHKLLDLLGDVTLLGARICGHVMAARSGHRTHLSFITMLAERAQA